MKILNSMRAFALALAGCCVVATIALAEQVVIQRHVTVREAPSQRADVLAFPEVGAALHLLDSGARSSGYYHVTLPDGRQGWVYSTFARREPDGPALAAGALASDRIAVHYINVDQGAAALLEFPCAAVMIDAGGRGDEASAHLIAYLDAFFARRPDLNRRLAAIYITHTHIDHNSNLQAVAQRYGVGVYIHNGLLTGSGKFPARWMVGFPPNTPAFAPTATPAIAVREVTEAQVLAAGGGGLSDAQIDPVACERVDPKVQVLSARYDENPGWPDGDFDNGNNQSLVIRVDYGGAAFLFTGDLEEPAIETLVSRYGSGRLLDVDVYAVGHHGSYNGTTTSLLQAVTPKAAVISFGPPTMQKPWTAWAYGHPRRDAVTMLDRGVSGHRPAPIDVLVADRVKVFSTYHLATAVYGTGWDGDVTISAGADGVLSIEPGR